jgi:hypothetical protein
LEFDARKRLVVGLSVIDAAAKLLPLFIACQSVEEMRSKRYAYMSMSTGFELHHHANRLSVGSCEHLVRVNGLTA